jgi:septum formation inhibitor-activating ATPase MinD
MTRAPLDIDALLTDRRVRILVCCGSGGVGKTTTAAAIGTARSPTRTAMCAC